MKLTLDHFRIPAATLLAIILVAIAIQQLFLEKNAPSAVEEQPSTITKKIEVATDPTVRFGFIRTIEKSGNAYSIIFDEAELFHNTNNTSTNLGAADLAAIEDGYCAKEDALASRGFCAPNGFYLRNNSASTTTFQLNAKTSIKVLAQSRSETEGVHLESISLPSLVKAFAESNTSNAYYALKEGPYLIKLDKRGTVLSLESQYLP